MTLETEHSEVALYQLPATSSGKYCGPAGQKDNSQNYGNSPGGGTEHGSNLQQDSKGGVHPGKEFNGVPVWGFEGWGGGIFEEQPETSAAGLREQARGLLGQEEGLEVWLRTGAFSQSAADRFHFVSRVTDQICLFKSHSPGSERVRNRRK